MRAKQVQIEPSLPRHVRKVEGAMKDMQFRDRAHAGHALAAKLGAYIKAPNTCVLGLPRGGVVVAFEVAKRLNLPMDVFLVRKLGVPGYPELAMGAIAAGGTCLLDWEMIRDLGISHEQIDEVVEREKQELLRRERLYCEGRAELDLRGRGLIVVDDGLATGSSMDAAVMALRQWQPARLVVAVPVAAFPLADHFKGSVDEAVSVMTPEGFEAVGQWYEQFSEVTDEEVRETLKLADGLPITERMGTAPATMR